MKTQLVALLLAACASGTSEPVPTRQIVFITLTPSAVVRIIGTDEPLPFRDLSTATPVPPSPTPPPPTSTLMPVVVSASTQIPTPHPLVSIQHTSLPATQPPSPTVAAKQPAPDVTGAEQAVIDLSNAERLANGLPPLGRDETMMSIARSRSADMVLRDYFGHTDPITGSLLAKPQVLAIGYGRAGENIFWGGTALAEFPARAVSWFMADPPHRANILNSGYTSIGVGVAWNGMGWMLTQDFGGP